MQSKFIEDVFKDYLAIKETNYAILINGSWGSGKTFFWKNTLSEISKSSGYKPIYLSLNGINKIETLDYQLKIKLIPYLNKLEIKKASAVAKVSKNIFYKLVEKYANFNPENILKDVEIDLALFSNNILCFDDLERCKIPLPEILGYINDYVEHKNLKVILLSHEKENDEKYNSIKEKVIGRVLNFENNLLDTIPLLFDKFKIIDTSFYDFLESKKDFILNLLVEYKEDNLRNIAFYLDSLSKIHSTLKLHNNYSDEVVIFVLIITIEFKKGKLTSNDYQDYKDYNKLNLAYSQYNFSKPKKKSFGVIAEKEIEEPKSNLELFYNKYLTNHIDKYFFYPSLYQFILSGYLDENLFLNELESRYPQDVSVETISFRKLLNYNFRELSNDEFVKLSTAVYGFALEGKYGIYDYLQLSNFYRYFSESNLINYSLDEIQQGLKTGLEISAKRKNTDRRLFESIFHFTNRDDDKLISAMIKEAHDKIEMEKELAKTNHLIVAIENNNSEAMKYIMSEYRIDKKLFEQIDISILCEKLIKSENKILSDFNKEMENRYNFGNVKDYLGSDYQPLKKLYEQIDIFLSDKNNYDLKSFLLKELSIRLKEICSKIA